MTCGVLAVLVGLSGRGRGALGCPGTRAVCIVVVVAAAAVVVVVVVVVVVLLLRVFLRGPRLLVPSS